MVSSDEIHRIAAPSPAGRRDNAEVTGMTPHDETPERIACGLE